jgi:methylated-DNA-[protein]-cysteine S-methyltransferase
MILQPTFSDRVRDVVRAIPKGEVRTYAQVAAAAGNTKAVRAVGTIMKNNFDTTIPCHRVIRSDGTVGEYNRGGSAAKKCMLVSEGVQLSR